MPVDTLAIPTMASLSGFYAFEVMGIKAQNSKIRQAEPPDEYDKLKGIIYYNISSFYHMYDIYKLYALE